MTSFGTFFVKLVRDRAWDEATDEKENQWECHRQFDSRDDFSFLRLQYSFRSACFQQDYFVRAHVEPIRRCVIGAYSQSTNPPCQGRDSRLGNGKSRSSAVICWDSVVCSYLAFSVRQVSVSSV